MNNVLIIDDDPDFCHGLSRGIQRLGRKAFAAETPAQGLEIARLQGVDVVFTNARLPDGAGLDLLPEIDLLPSHPEVIVITGA
jgi:two-component system NtrC family response regulator